MCQEGFKRLNQLLDSDALLHTLDVTTLRIRPSDKGVPGASPASPLHCTCSDILEIRAQTEDSHGQVMRAVCMRFMC